MWNSVRESVRHATEDLDRFLDIRGRGAGHAGNGKQGNKNAMTNVVTPNSIPKFTVPPLLTYPSCDGQQEDEKPVEVGCDSTRSSRRSSLSKEKSAAQLTAERISMTEQVRKLQPGLSLSHLLHTKSGFSTLSESPNTRRKESLFLSPSPTYHAGTDGNLLADLRLTECVGSSSDSEKSRSQTPAVSPMLGLLKRRNNPLLYNRMDSESNSSCNTSPSRSPTSNRKNRAQKGNAQAPKGLCSNSHHPPSCNCLQQQHQQQTQVPFKSKFLGDKGPSHNRSYSDSVCEASSAKRSKNFLDYSKLKLHQQQLQEHDNEVNNSIKHNPPRIHISMTYFPSQRRLDVSVIDINNLTGDRLLYLKVSLLPRHGASHRSETLRANSANVEVRERFCFDGVNQTEISHLSLKIACKEKGTKLRPSTPLGVSILTLADIEFASPYDTWLEMKDPATEEVPHLQLSLCYHAMLGFVTIEVIAVRNVPRGHLGRNQDCYVVLTEENASEGTAKKQTKISHRCKDPMFKESFIFAMPNDRLVIIAALFVRDKMKGHWSPCGQVKLGHGVGDWSGQDQWTQALDKEGQSVTFWHLLRNI